ncbi:RNA dependent RNA polymerase [Bacillus infantis]|uniref:RNA dependent RNA polymerase n=1 Tax=Bacillus infantis TaxID=324767 RepID=UPI003CFB3478
MKRSQVTIKQYHLNNITLKDGKMVITEEGREIEHFRNFFMEAIDHILQRKMPKDTYFILEFDEIGDEDEETLELYEKALRNGIWLNNVHYIKSVKSPSMVRTQKTLFIRSNIAEKVIEHVSLGKIPTHAIVSKLEAALGISLSSVLMVEPLPKIVFVKDMKKIIKEDIEVIRDCEKDPVQIAEIDIQIEKQNELRKAWKDNKPSEEELKKLAFYDWTDFKTHKSKNAWYKEGRNLKIDQITKPVGYGQRGSLIYPVYTIEQTEEIEFPKCSKSTIGKEIHHLENHEVPMTMFDGQALGSFEWFEKVSENLNLNYITNGIQGRLPYFKGLIVRFDIKKWCKENNVTEIVDLFDNSHDVDSIDIIATESCWKTFHDYSSGKKECLFSLTEEWYELMEKYGVKTFGVANFAKAEYLMPEFTPLNYQFIYALPKLSYKDLRALSKPYEKLLYKVKEGKDIAYIRAFLQMMDGNKETQHFSDKCLDMINIDERMIFDNKIQRFLRNRVSEELKNLMRGRIPIRGGYRYITQDVIAFMEWAAYKKENKVKGFLNTPYTVFKRKTEGEYLLMRNPTTSPKETVRAQFVDSNNKFVKHLDTIIISSVNDLLLPKFTADVDGDTVLYTNEPRLLNGMHDNVPLIHEDDKQFSVSDKVEYSEYNLEEIINYEMNNTSSMIGILTNWNTEFQDLALANDDYIRADLVVSVNKIYQMQLIDAAKTGEKVEIAYPISAWGKKLKKPYFMFWVYGGKRDDYSSDTNSPLNKYVKWIEEQQLTLNPMTIRKIDHEYYTSISNPVELLQYRKELPSPDYIKEVVEEIKPLYDEYSEERIKIDQERKEFNSKAKVKQDPEERKIINAKFSAVKQKYRLLCHKVEPNMSILATAAVELAYRQKDRPDFAWDVAFEGMRWNALQNRLENRTDLHRLKYHGESDLAGVATVSNGRMEIKQEEINRKETRFLDTPIYLDTDLEDGKYTVLSIMGKHYAVYDKENNHPEYMCHKWYKKSEIEKPEVIENKKVRFLTRGRKAKDVIDQLLGNEFKVKTVPDKGYVNIVNGDSLICCVAPDVIDKSKISMNMDEWVIRFNSIVTPSKPDQKSFSAYVTIIEG